MVSNTETLEKLITAAQQLQKSAVLFADRHSRGEVVKSPTVPLMLKLSLPAQGSVSAPFKPFNDCLLSLKAGTKSENETAPEMEKKAQKAKK